MGANPGDLNLKLTSRCNRIGIAAGDQPQPVYLLTQVIPDLTTVDRRMPLNIAVILDHSSPAMTEGLPVFKQALKDLTDKLQAMDYFSLVSLAGPVIIAAQPPLEKTHLKRQIDKVAITDEALSAEGLAEGLRQVLANRSERSISRILLILADEIETGASQLEHLADLAGSSGVPISVIGFGNNWDDLRWIELTDRSIQAAPGSLNGMLDYAPSLEEVAEVMQRVYRSLHVVASNVRLTLRFLRGVEVRQIWRVAPTIHCIELPPPAEQVLTLHAAELSQEGTAYLLEAILPPRSAGQARIVQTEAAYTSLDNTAIHQSVDLVVEFSQDVAGTNPLDSDVMNFVDMAQAHRLNIAALDDLEAGNRQAAIQKFRQAAAILLSQGQSELADRIRGEADYNVRQYGQISNEGRKMILLTGRSAINPEVG